MPDQIHNATSALEEWSAVLATREGLQLHVRSVNPDDGALIKSFLEGLAPDDLRYRFLTPLVHPSASLIDSLVRVDHVGTEDFLAFADVDGRKAPIATAMLAADPSLVRAEVAIAILPEYQKRGVGWTLLEFVAKDAAARGIKTLESVESRDNHAAIDLEREMGFTACAYPGDATLMLVRKKLN